MQRVFMVADGTVTQMMESYLLQPVDSIVFGQQARRLEIEDHWLVAVEGTEVCERRVVLRGRRDKVPYLHAVSTIVLDRLPAQIVRGLELKSESIGRLLLRYGVESRRERLWYGLEKPDSLPDPISGWSEVLSRTYRIVSGGQPLMLIEEKIPRTWPD